MHFCPVLLFQTQSVENFLPLSDFSPIFEVFMGIGFAFYVLTRIDDFLHYILGVRQRADQSIVATIDVNIELTKTLAQEASDKQDSETVLDISDYENRLIDLKGEIEHGKNRILYNSRFYFLALGLHAFTLLIFCGLERYCLITNADFKPGFYSAILFASVYFIVVYVCLTLWTFQESKDAPVMTKIFLLLAGLFIAVLVGVMAKMDIVPCEALVIFGVVSQLAPFGLLMHRHNRFQRFIRISRFDQSVNEVSQKLLRIKIRLNQ